MAAGAILEDVVQQNYALSPRARVSIHNTDGRIFVFGSDEARLEITAVRRAFSKERLEATKVAVSIEGEVATIDTIYPRPSGDSLLADRSGTVDYTIVLPQNCPLVEVTLANGEVLLEGLRGKRVEARLDRGLMRMRNCFTAALLNLAEGKMNVSYDWWETRAFSVSAEVGKGSLNVAVPTGAALHLEAAAAQGTIRNAFGMGGRGRIQRLEQAIGGESEVEFNLRTEAGNIRMERAY